ncbi:hypothetical protein KOAAANKH_03633 [Brevundimonas sp. NIBR10]|uniref:hypothetical protein n=1 Tax=Brevundimonas sp. NIBR10 TaxID=3015997 RepID=UPI0022F1D3B1|nr:hypothetical protein [Brevundimonas sp. NIBR10]WGM48726.1 hypothetical protein KOAAANKH_03633 [Brevundimonas sp. NIBR10]
MAGMKDEAGRAMQGRSLAVDHLAGLQAMVDEEMGQLRESPSTKGEILTIERRVRTIGAMARTIKLVDGLLTKPAKSHANDNEDDMSEDAIDDGDDDMDPAEVATIRAELESRLDRIRAAIETKRMAGRSQRSADAGAAFADAAPA